MTPREVVAQSLDYASWVEGLATDEITAIVDSYVGTYRPDLKPKTFNQVFKDRFGFDLENADMNQSHQIVVVASRLDSSTERIVKYLAARGIEINVVFFKVFSDEGRQLLSRVWFIDPESAGDQMSLTPRVPKGEWNGDSYVSFGVDARRNWSDAVKYGFVSAGGGRWYTATLSLLNAGDRVFVNVPKRGYVGVGIVEEPVKRIDEFLVNTENGTLAPILGMPLQANMGADKDDPDVAEYLVRVRWLKTVPLDRAIREIGFFGNQNSACRPVAPKWKRTVERLIQLFDLEPKQD